MAIRMKRGKLSELDTSLVKSGEILVATDTEYVAYAKGQSDVVQLASKKEVLNAIKNGVLVDVEGKKLVFRQNRSQPILSYFHDYEVARSYDVEYGNGITTVDFALKEFLKVFKPEMTYNGIYNNIESTVKNIFRMLKTIVSPNDVVYVECVRLKTSSSDKVTIRVYYGEWQGNDIRLNGRNNVAENTGRGYYNFPSTYRIRGKFRSYTIQPSGEYEESYSDNISYTLMRMGIFVNSTTLAVSNIGMNADYVVNENEYEWDFTNSEVVTQLTYKYVFDKVSGCGCRLYGNADIVDGELYIPDSSSFLALPYLFQNGRKVEIEYGECDRHYSTNYIAGEVCGNYSSSNYTGLVFPAYTVSSLSPKMQMRDTNTWGTAVDIADPNILSRNKLYSNIENGSWTVTIGDSSTSIPNTPTGLVYSRVGKISTGSTASLYRTRIRKIKVLRG